MANSKTNLVLILLRMEFSPTGVTKANLFAQPLI